MSEKSPEGLGPAEREAEIADDAWAPQSVLPVVAGNPGNGGLYLFLGCLLAGGIALFTMLDANRQAREQSSIFTASGSPPGVRINPPPPLAVPARFVDRPPVTVAQPARVATQAQPTQGSIARPVSRPIAVAPSFTPPEPSLPSQTATATPSAAETVRARPTPPDPDRVSAGRFTNPAQTVPKGTVIQAVLETALDSTRPGAVRALVQRDVVGFDGTRVLIPRGSRLLGEYQSDLAAGQNRALIQWTRLMRPDGVVIALNSQAADPLGRAGVKGKVDGKFFQRFGGAILQSVLDIGVASATREATGGVVVALPGSTQNLQIQQQGEVQPTLKVRHGTSVSVFVSRDLDFSGFGQ